jgi:hypothetical protein
MAAVIGQCRAAEWLAEKANEQTREMKGQYEWPV